MICRQAKVGFYRSYLFLLHLLCSKGQSNMKIFSLKKEQRPYLIILSIIAVIFLFLVPGFFFYIRFIFLPDLERQPIKYFDEEFLIMGGLHLSPNYLRGASLISIIVPPIFFLITASILATVLFLKYPAKESIEKILKLLIFGFICISLIELGFLYFVWSGVIEWYSNYSRGCLYPSAEGFKEINIHDFAIRDNGKMGLAVSTSLQGETILSNIQAQLNKNILCTTNGSISVKLTDEHKVIWISCINKNNLQRGDCIKASVTISYTNNGEERKTIGKITAFVETA